MASMMRVCAAAAIVVVHEPHDVGAAGLRVLPQEANAAKNHSRRAKAALQGVALSECLLQRMQFAVLGQSFDGNHLFALDPFDRDLARLDRLSVQEHGT